jgi:hypothetical protein
MFASARRSGLASVGIRCQLAHNLARPDADLALMDANAEGAMQQLASFAARRDDVTARDVAPSRWCLHG